MVSQKAMRPYTPDTIVKGLQQRVRNYQPENIVQAGLRGAIIGIVEGLVGTRTKRVEVLYKIFPEKWESLDDVTTKDLGDAEWYALKEWVKPWKPEDAIGGWQGCTSLVVEISQILQQPLGGQEHLSYQRHTDYIQTICEADYGGVPTMECGHQADSLTIFSKPFCGKCADSGRNREAYTIAGNRAIEETSNG